MVEKNVMGNEGQAARLEGELFYEAFKVSPIGIALEDLQGRPLFANPALCSMLGFSEEEMRSKHCVDFSPPEDSKKDWALFEQLQKGLIDRYQMDKRFFRRDGSLMWGRLNISLLNHRPSPLVVALVEDITEKRSVQETLELVSSRLAIVNRCSRDLRYLWVNQRYSDLLERPLDEIIGHPILEVVGKEAFESLQHHFERVLAGERVRYEEEVNYRSVGRRWISAAYTPTLNASGAVDGWVAVLVDVTERKQMEKTLRRLNRKLIEAHEEERTRIARELHDDISQRLALLMLKLDRLGTDDQTSAAEFREAIVKTRENLSSLAHDVQALSHRLHSSKLEYFGLANAVASYCSEISNRHQVVIELQSENVPDDLSPEISVCMFRVLQEACQNAVKHSRSQRLDVSFSRKTSGMICLTVHDSGIGFDLVEALKGQGLGLVSMKERLDLVGGELSIESQPGTGTTIHVCVPLIPETERGG